MAAIDRVGRDARDFGQHLAAWRKLLGYTSEQVAVRAGISRPTLSKLENGDPTVSLNSVLAVARALGVAQRLVASVDPYDSDLGRASADRVLPERVRR